MRDIKSISKHHQERDARGTHATVSKGMPYESFHLFILFIIFFNSVSDRDRRPNSTVMIGGIDGRFVSILRRNVAVSPSISAKITNHKPLYKYVVRNAEGTVRTYYRYARCTDQTLGIDIKGFRHDTRSASPASAQHSSAKTGHLP